MKSLNHLVLRIPDHLETGSGMDPWVHKRLDATEDESHAIFRQSIPVSGEASALEVATEKCYEREVEA